MVLSDTRYDVKYVHTIKVIRDEKCGKGESSTNCRGSSGILLLLNDISGSVLLAREMHTKLVYSTIPPLYFFVQLLQKK